MESIADTINTGRDIILTMDENEHMVKGKLDKKLKNASSIEAHCNKLKSEGPASCFIDRN